MKSNTPEPNLHTDPSQYNEVEKAKLASNYALGDLPEDFRSLQSDDLKESSEALAKSHGLYLEYNRAKTGREKDWMYMIRITVPGGGAFNAQQWRIIDEISDRYTVGPGGKPSIRLTTRQNIQFHWVKKKDVIPVIQRIAETGFYTLNGCGDNTRNVMACPLSRYSNLYDAHAQAHAYAAYFRLPTAAHIQIFEIDTSLDRAAHELLNGSKLGHFEYAPNLLNRKFKIAFSTVHRDPQTGVIERDNCVELRTNDMGVAPIVENDKVVAFQVYIGGGQGEKNGKPTFAGLSVPLGIFTPENLHKGLDAVVKVHQEWGDRQNRHWARLKYVVYKQGIEWYQQQVRALGAVFEPPDPSLDPGPRRLHHGWQTLEKTGKLAFGLYVENGRLIDRDASNPADGGSGAGSTAGNSEQLKKMVPYLLEKYPGVEAMITPNQDLLLVNIDPSAKEDFEADIRRFNHGTRHGKPYSKLRLLSGACVGLPTCRLSYTDSEQFEPELIDQLEAMGYGDVAESIGITGCERQCFRPATKTLGWVGQGPDLYGLKVFGSEDGRHQGQWLVADGKWYLRQVPREKVAVVSAALFDLYAQQRQAGETDMGRVLRRLGSERIIAYLKSNPSTAPLMEKTAAPPFQLERV